MTVCHARKRHLTQGMNVGGLRQRATEAGVNGDAIEDARDLDNPKVMRRCWPASSRKAQLQLQSEFL